MKHVNLSPDSPPKPEVLSISMDGEIKVWNLEMTLQTFSANKNIVKAKVIDGVSNVQTKLYFILLLSDDGILFVYKFDALGITKVGLVQTWVDRDRDRVNLRLADFELVMENGKWVLILLEKAGKIRGYEIE